MIQKSESDSSPFADVPLKDIKPLDYARRNWFPRAPRRKAISLATIYRWVQKGLHGVQLQALRTPQYIGTTEQACRQFLLDVDAAKRAEPAANHAMSDEEVAEVFG